jgi:spermidine/putrescine transport system substrate-binding protein
VEVHVNPNVNRKGFLALTGGVSLAAFLAACGGGSDSGSSSAGGDAAATTTAAGAQGVFDPATEPGGPIEIFTWAGYDDTEGDGAPWMWADYQASEYGDASPLKFTFLEDDTQALAKVASGYSPDVMHPCVAWVPQWKAAGLIQPLDLSLLPDWDGIPEDVKAGGKIDGAYYHVPFDVGFSSIAYDADVVNFDTTGGEESWRIYLDDALKGKLSFFADPSAIICISHMMNEGAVNPNVLDDAQIAAAKETAMKWKPNLRNYWTSQTDTVNDFVNGNLVATYTWPDGFWKIKNHPKMKGRNIKYMWPSEGRLAWVCGFVLSAATKQPGRASQALASANTPTAGAALTDYFQYASAQQKDVSELIQDKELVKAFSIDDPTAWEAPRTWFEAPLPNYKAVIDAGEEVKAS